MEQAKQYCCLSMSLLQVAQHCCCKTQEAEQRYTYKSAVTEAAP